VIANSWRTAAVALLCAGLVGLSLAQETRRRPAPRPAPPAPAVQPASPEFPALEAVEREVARLAESARPSVVGIIARSRLEPLLESLGERVRIEAGAAGTPLARRIGSGVVLDTHGHVVTLTSVVAGATEVMVLPFEGEKLRARVKGLDDYSGLAVLELEGAPGVAVNLQPIVYADSDSLRPGALVTSISSPFGSAPGSPVYSFGFISGTGVSQGPGRRCPYIKFNSYAAPGAGGGPVFDSKGHLAGVLFGAGDTPQGEGESIIRWEVPGRSFYRVHHGDEEADQQEDQDHQDYQDGSDDDEDAPAEAPPAPHAPPVWILKSLKRPDGPGGGTAYAVPSNVVRRVTDQIIQSGSARRGWVGVKIEETEPGEVRLLAVVPGGPAEKAGLKVGDRIISLNDETLSTPGRLVEGISACAPGAQIRLGIDRDGRPMRVALTLGEAPEPTARPLRVPLPPKTPWMRPAVLGVDVDVDTDDETRARLGAPEGVGLLIQKVYDNTRAQQAGLQVGDVLVEAMGMPIGDLDDLRRALRRQGPREMEIKIVRKEKPMTLRVAPGVETPAPSAPPPPPPAPASAAPRRPPA